MRRGKGGTFVASFVGNFVDGTELPTTDPPSLGNDTELWRARVEGEQEATGATEAERMTTLSVLHHTRRVGDTGGMQVVFERPCPSGGEVAGIVAFHERDETNPLALAAPELTIRKLRRRYAERVSVVEGSTHSLYHNGWGLDLVADLDPSAVRVLFLHTDLPGLPTFIRHNLPWVDAILTVNAGLAAKVRRIAGDQEQLIVDTIPYPIDLPAPYVAATDARASASSVPVNPSTERRASPAVTPEQRATHGF